MPPSTTSTTTITPPLQPVESRSRLLVSRHYGPGPQIVHSATLERNSYATHRKAGYHSSPALIKASAPSSTGQKYIGQTTRYGGSGYVDLNARVTLQFAAGDIPLLMNDKLTAKAYAAFSNRGSLAGPPESGVDQENGEVCRESTRNVFEWVQYQLP